MKQDCASRRLVKNDSTLTKSILALEWEMFQTVPTAQRYRCQEDQEGFNLHRLAQFAAWSVPTLDSYLHDLRQAKAAGRNLLAIKYARMEDLLPCENFSPRIDTIFNLAMEGQEEFVARYPNLMRGGRPLNKSEDGPDQTSFATYLRGELETYSETTLGLLLGDMLMLQKYGTSLSEVIYSYLAKQVGFDSIDALEKSLRD